MTIHIRLLNDDDMPALMALSSQPHVRDALSWDDRVLTQRELAAVLMRADPGTVTEAFGILHAEKGNLIGAVCLADQHPIHRSGMITNLAVIRKSGCEHAGYDAGMWMVRYAFQVKNLHRVECRVWEGNDVTPRFCVTAGGKLDGVLRKAIYRHGRYIDVSIYSLLRSEWESQNGLAAA